MCTVAIAFAARDDFSFISSLVGSLGATPLSFIFPCFLHGSLYKGELSLSDRIAHAIIPIIGVVGGIYGVSTTIDQLIHPDKGSSS